MKKLKKDLIKFVCFLLVLSFFGMYACGNSDGNFINDSAFLNGFKVGSLTDGDTTILGTLSTYNNNSEPVWTVKQWYSKYDISSATKHETESGGIRYESEGKNSIPGKVVEVNKDRKSIYLECNTSVEYDAPREDKQGWPHLLVSQDIKEIVIKDVSSINLSFNYKVTKIEDYISDSPEYESDKHAVGCYLYFSVRNSNENSPGNGDWFWFGLRLFDNRLENKPFDAYAKKDGNKENNTGKFIYQLASEDYFVENKMPVRGTDVSIGCDILPLLDKALTKAKSEGFMNMTYISDCTISYMNLGWEVFGTYNVGIEISDLELYCQ